MLIASVLGVLIVLILFIAIMVASLSPSSAPIANNSILKISLRKPLEDRAGIPSISLSGMTIESNTGLNTLLYAIEQAKYDSRVNGVYLDLSSVAAGIASLEEIREALQAFKRESGKYVVAYSEYYSQKAYYLATVADKVYLNPMGSLDFSGLSTEAVMFKGLLDKLGIDMQIIRHGKFKSAVEPFTLDKMSDENRTQIKEYLTSIWNAIARAVAEARDISLADLNLMADALEPVLAEDVLAKNFVDKLLYEDEVIAELRKYSNAGNIKFIEADEYYTPGEPGKGDKIALIYASGEIMSGEGDSDIMSKSVAAVINKARGDSSVRAVVLRVNSPGGSALASEAVARELELVKKHKPLVISMGNVAASGGYWIAVPGAKIFAHRTTLTGSIGVFGMIPNIGKAAKDKLGITFDVVTTNKHSDFPSITRPLQPAETNYLQKHIENVYSKFVNKVAQARNLTPAQVDSLAQGRVWSGEDALKTGLIDDLGGIKTAVEAAAQMAGISEYTILELPKELGTLEALIRAFEMKMSKAQNDALAEAMKPYEYLAKSLKNYGIMAKLPFALNENF